MIRTLACSGLVFLLQEIPDIQQQTSWKGPHPEHFDWDGNISEVLEKGKEVPEIKWCQPGQDAGWQVRLAIVKCKACLPESLSTQVAADAAGVLALLQAVVGNNGFISRMKNYHERRNNPNLDALSNLSPYLHYGQLSAQQMAVEVAKHKAKHRVGQIGHFQGQLCTFLPRSVHVASHSDLHGNKYASMQAEVDAFLEEAVVRRELSDNFCFYEPNYDNFEAFSDWAKDSLNKHRGDKREHLYTWWAT